MKCPFCNAEMQSGVVQSTHGIFWLESPARVPVKPSMKKEAKHISNYPEGIWADWPYVKGYRCRSCNWILIQPE